MSAIRKFKIILVLFTGFMLWNQAAFAKPYLASVLEQDKNDGVISLGMTYYYQYQARIGKINQLPEKYQTYSVSPNHSFSLFKSEVKYHWSEFSLQEQQLLMPMFWRPSSSELPLTVKSPLGYFLIHYTTDGEDAVSQEFLSAAAENFDLTYNYLVNQLGFYPPPIDNTDSPEYDIYIRNQNPGDYGSTTSESADLSTERDDYSSWIEIDNDFTQTFTKGLNGLRVTATHEFFHAIHFGYKSFTNELDRFFYEASATWLEDELQDDINDYLQYLPDMFQAFYIPVYKHHYAFCIFNKMLEKKYGAAIIKRMWDEFISYRSFEAIDRACNFYNSSFAYELTDFAIWNVYTGDKADTLHYYSEGNLFPSIQPMQAANLNSEVVFQDNAQNYSLNYYSISVKTNNNFVLEPTFESSQYWKCASVLEQTDNHFENQMTSGEGEQEFNLIVGDKLWLAAVHTTWSSSSNSNPYKLTVKTGDITNHSDDTVEIFPNPFKPEQATWVFFKYCIDSPSDNSVMSILNENGTLVKQIELGKQLCGQNTTKWDGKTKDGVNAASGVYLVLFQGNEIKKPSKFLLIR